MHARFACLAALSFAALAASAQAQVPNLHNGGFEIDDPYLAGPPFNFRSPSGYRLYNCSKYRWIGQLDMADQPVLPPAVVHTGNNSILLPGSVGCTAGEFQGVHAEVALDLGMTNSPVNWPQYNFNPPNGAPITVGCWFNIPASDPMVKSRFGLKLGLINVDNPGIFFAREWLDVDPQAAVPFPGCTFVTVTTPDGPLPGIHTNGQWLRLERTLTQAEINYPVPGTGNPPWMLPTNPARSTLLALRFVIPNPCPADFNGTGGITVADIFAFLSAWFEQTGLTGPGHTADFNRDNVVSVPDIFAFLTAWFVGTCVQTLPNTYGTVWVDDLTYVQN